MDDYQKIFLDLLFNKGTLKVDGEYMLKNKRVSPWFFNTGDLNDGQSLNVIGESFAKQIPLNTNVVFGPAYKGIPLAVATVIAIQSPVYGKVSYSTYRKEEKTYGEATGEDLQKKVLIGARIKDGDKITLVDDVFTDGGTKYDALNLLNKMADNLIFNSLLVVIDRQEVNSNGENAIAKFSRETGIPVKPMISALDVYDFLIEKNMNPQAHRIKKYLLDYGTDEVKKDFEKR